MTGRTSIEWTWPPGYQGASWNPTVGCTRVSAGCDRCYAFALHDKRYKANLKAVKDRLEHEHDESTGRPWPSILDFGLPNETHPQFGRRMGIELPFPKQYDLPFSRVQLLPDRLDVPLRTKKPTCYFVDSMSDLFHEDVPDEYIARVFATMIFATWHKFLILTKRPERMAAFLRSEALQRRDFLPADWYERNFRHIDGTDLGRIMAGQMPYWWPAPNVWVGTSTEDQTAADERIPNLLATPAAVRFLSCEPLIGSLDLGAWLPDRPCYWCSHPRLEHYFGEKGGDPHCCWGAVKDECSCQGYASPIALDLQWVIIGGESGPRARPMDLAWARSLVAQCRAAGVAVFVKQLGSDPRKDSFHINDHGDEIEDRFVAVRLHESHGRDMSEWPEDLRIREWPR